MEINVIDVQFLCWRLRLISHQLRPAGNRPPDGRHESRVARPRRLPTELHSYNDVEIVQCHAGAVLTRKTVCDRYGPRLSDSYELD